MNECDYMSYSQCKKYIEKDGFYRVDETPTEIIVKSDRASIIFNKKTMQYTAIGYGGQLAFTTYPIYEKWRAMIKAWMNEQNFKWAERRKEE